MGDLEKAGSSSDPTVEVGTTENLLPARVRKSTSDDLLQNYLAEVRRYALLSPEEERELAETYVDSGDPVAAQKLVTSNLRLVVKLAFQYHRQWSNVLDLIQEGNVGLMEALKKYDPYRGVRFSSYAQYWIRAMILRFLMDNFRMVRLGTTRAGRKLFFQLKKERDRMIEMGLTPSTKELAEALSVSESEVAIMDQHLRAPALSMHAPESGDTGQMLEESVSHEDQVATDEEAAQNQFGALLHEQLLLFRGGLKNDREIAIWDERLTAKDPLSLSALGRRFGLTKERVRQLEFRMKRQLKEALVEAFGKEVAFEFHLPEEE
jgi:RNA polymerase sigma-32 factor